MLVVRSSKTRSVKENDYKFQINGIIDEMDNSSILKLNIAYSHEV